MPLPPPTAIAVTDAVSEPFLCRVSFHSAEHDLDLAGLVGRGYGFTLPLPGGSSRPFHGLVARAEMGETTVRSTRYDLEIRPWFHFLKQSRHCRVFQAKSVPEIAKEVAGAAGFTAIEEKLAGQSPKLEYAVQYNESDFDFLSRLMAEAGLFYYFTHTEGAHSMVLADGAGAGPKGPALAWLGGVFPDTAGDSIWNLRLSRTAHAKSVKVDDYNCLTPAAGLAAAAGKGWPEDMEFGTGHAARAEGEGLAGRRLDALESTALELAANSASAALAAGVSFTVKGAPRSDLNKTWLAHRVEISLDEAGRLAVALLAWPAEARPRPPWRPRRPSVPGPLTGVVTGPKDQEIHTDAHGRVKVRPHWDKESPADEKASVWLRVAQPWAGAGRGAFFLPRVGDEVLIGFLGGDPDRPIVTGALHNAANIPPWNLPEMAAVSGLKSRSVPKGQGGNEISLDDRQDQERLYFHAQKLLEILAENERRVTVAGEGGDRLVLEKGDREVLMKKGDDRLTLEEGGRSVDIVKGGDRLTVKGNRAVEIQGAEMRTVKKALTLTVDGDHSITVKGDLTIRAGSIKLVSDKTLAAEAGTDLNLKAGTSLNLKAGAGFKLAASAKGEVDGGGILAIKGGMVKLN